MKLLLPELSRFGSFPLLVVLCARRVGTVGVELCWTERLAIVPRLGWISSEAALENWPLESVEFYEKTRRATRTDSRLGPADDFTSAFRSLRSSVLQLGQFAYGHSFKFNNQRASALIEQTASRETSRSPGPSATSSVCVPVCVFR